jgi:hypothetical protein
MGGGGEGRIPIGKTKPIADFSFHDAAGNIGVSTVDVGSVSTVNVGSVGVSSGIFGGRGACRQVRQPVCYESNICQVSISYIIYSQHIIVDNTK